MQLYNLKTWAEGEQTLYEAQVIKRPSKYIKTPYVADVSLLDPVSKVGMVEDGEKEQQTVLAHSASLGCCGLADKDAHVLMTKMKADKNPKGKEKCAYRICLAVIPYCENGVQKETIVGIHPKLAEELVENALYHNCLSKLQNISNLKREVSIRIGDKVNSRFDFTGVDDNNIPFILEVKNVPLADFEDVTSKDKKKMDFTGRDYNSKVSYFPDGYRKKSADPVSPRALKHIRELEIICNETKVRCILCFVIQRTDIDRFTTSQIDMEYKNAVKQAANNGVEIYTLVVEWRRDGTAHFVRDDLPILL